ncbi:MAG: [acyl-carrier-protein] S-malonyltransferase [Oleiphilaceae bacterium]|jgi:[acyl-carrier-protein] S-malonyltransferase
MKTVFMFPGQGSQSIGMMAELLEEFDIARQVFNDASAAIGIDLKEIALYGPGDRINQTAITQPLVLTASIAMWRVWESQTDIKPDFVCGHSLGEYSALVASGVLLLKDAVRLVHLRGSLMQDAVPMGEGGMAAILGLDEASVELACQEAAQGDVVAAANYNSPGQVVISGASEALARAMIIAKEKGAKRATKLPVSVPCHCDLLKPAGESLAQEMEKTLFNPLLIPIVQNVSAAEVSDLSELKTNLLAHLHRPVLWSQSITALAKNGAQTFIECGPGKVLTGLNKRIDKTFKTMSMNDSASMAKVLAEFA